MSKYLVHLNHSLSQVVISLDGYGPTQGEGLTKIGQFEVDVDPNDAQVLASGDLNELAEGPDHPFINKAREILQEHLGEHNSTKGYTFLERATNAVPDVDPADTMSTNDLPATEGPNHHSEASTQPGGVQNSQTGEHNPAVQESGEKANTPPATETATGEGKESVTALKERLKTITDKAELQKVYDEEQAGEKRSTALAAIEARAAELNAE